MIDVTRLHEPDRGVRAHFKAPTTPNVSDGIEAAVREVLRLTAVPPTDITSLSIGTTAFINAVLEADSRRLAKVAVVRLCGPYTKQCPPFIDFPKRLRALTEGHVGYVDGGFESKFTNRNRQTASHWNKVDGREIAPLNVDQVIEQCANIKEKALNNVCYDGHLQSWFN